jgi:hypothetical protein
MTKLNQHASGSWHRCARGVITAVALAACFGVGPASSGIVEDWTDDPQDQATKLALEYVQTGGNTDQIGQELESALADEAKSVALDAVALGMDALLPGSGEAAQAIPALLGIFNSLGGGSSTSPNAAIISAINKINSRLDKIEAGMSVIASNVDKLNAAEVRLANSARRDFFVDQPGHLGVFSQLRKLSNELKNTPPKDRAAKLDYLGRILDVADGFIAYKNKKLATDVWAWDRLIVRRPRPGEAPGVKTDFEANAPFLHLALEPYLQNLALFVTAENALDITPDDALSKRLNKHIVFLAGGDSELAENEMLFSLLQRTSPIACGEQNSGPNGDNVHLFCSSQGITKSEVIDASTTPNWSLGPEEFILKNLKEEVRTALLGGQAGPGQEQDPLTKLVVAADKSLQPSPAPTSQNHFPMSRTILGTDTIFAVDSNGRIHQFVHEIVQIDTWAKEENPSTNSKQPWDPAKSIDPSKLKILQHQDDSGSDVTHPSDGNSNKVSSSVTTAPGSVRMGGPLTNSGIDPNANFNSSVIDHPTPFTRYKITHDFFESEKVAGKWGDFSSVIPSQQFAQGLVVYGLRNDGKLIWRRIDNHENDSHYLIVLESNSPPNPVGTGWNTMSNVFSTGEGIIYGVAANGDLVWYHHINNVDGYTVPAQWAQHPVGNGWGTFLRLFSPGKGRIYAVQPDGTLLWYQHTGYLDGTKVWSGPRKIGTGWNQFQKIFAGPDGDIYAINASGELLFYKHLGWEKGENSWDDPVKLADGWGNYTAVFAAMGYAGDAPPFQQPN